MTIPNTSEDEKIESAIDYCTHSKQTWKAPRVQAFLARDAQGTFENTGHDFFATS